MIGLLWYNGRLDSVVEMDWHPPELRRPFIDHDGSYYAERYRATKLHQGGELISYSFIGMDR